VPVIAGTTVFCGAPVAALASPDREKMQTSAAKSAVTRVLETSRLDATAGAASRLRFSARWISQVRGADGRACVRLPKARIRPGASTVEPDHAGRNRFAIAPAMLAAAFPTSG